VAAHRSRVHGATWCRDDEVLRHRRAPLPPHVDDGGEVRRRYRQTKAYWSALDETTSVARTISDRSASRRSASPKSPPSLGGRHGRAAGGRVAARRPSSVAVGGTVPRHLGLASTPRLTGGEQGPAQEGVTARLFHAPPATDRGRTAVPGPGSEVRRTGTERAGRCTRAEVRSRANRRGTAGTSSRQDAQRSDAIRRAGRAPGWRPYRRTASAQLPTAAF